MFPTPAQLRNLPPITLLSEIQRLQNSIMHLRRSNLEMLEHDPEKHDEDLVEAMKENEEIIKKQEVRIEIVKHILIEIGAGHALDELNEIDSSSGNERPRVNEAREEEDLSGIAVEGSANINRDYQQVDENEEGEEEEGVFM